MALVSRSGAGGNVPGNSSSEAGNAASVACFDVTRQGDAGRSDHVGGCRDRAKTFFETVSCALAGPEVNGLRPSREPLSHNDFPTSSRRVNQESATTVGGLQHPLSGCPTTNPGLGQRYRIDIETSSNTPGNPGTVTPAVTVIAAVALPNAGQVFHSFSTQGGAASRRHEGPCGVVQ